LVKGAFMLSELKEALQNPVIQIILGIDAGLFLCVLSVWTWVFILWLLDKPWRRWFYKPKPFKGNPIQIFTRPVELREL